MMIIRNGLLYVIIIKIRLCSKFPVAYGAGVHYIEFSESLTGL